MPDEEEIVEEYIDEDWDEESDTESPTKKESKAKPEGGGGEEGAAASAAAADDAKKKEDEAAKKTESPPAPAAAEQPKAETKPAAAAADAAAEPPAPVKKEDPDSAKTPADKSPAKASSGKEGEEIKAKKSDDAPNGKEEKEVVKEKEKEKEKEKGEAEAVPPPTVPGKSPPRSPRALKVEAGGGAAASKVSAKLKVFLDDAFVGDLQIALDDEWDSVLSKLRAMEGRAVGFEYDVPRGKEGVQCKDSSEWNSAQEVLSKGRKKELDVAIMVGGGDDAAPQKKDEERVQAAASSKKEENQTKPPEMTSIWAAAVPAVSPPASPVKAAPSARPAAKAGGGATIRPLTRAQKIFRDKIVRPRKPGVMDVLRAFGAMPNSVCLSPLPRNRGGSQKLEAMWGEGARGAKGVVSFSVQIAAANNIPGIGSTYDVMSRRARACVCSRSSRSFLCPPHSVPLSRKNEGKVEWVFSQKDSSNPFSVRAHHGAGDVGLYIELSCLVRRKGTTSTGPSAYSSGDIKEVSCGHAYLPLTAQAPAPGKQSLAVQGGTPWAPVDISADDIPKSSGGGLMGAFKKQDKAPHIEVTWSSFASEQDDGHLPKNMVFPSKVVETLSLFSRLSSPPSNVLFTRRVNYDPFASAFLRLAGDAITLAKLAELWDDAAKKLGKKADDEKRQEAFRECAASLVQMASLAPDIVPMPSDSFDEVKKEERAKAVDTFCKESDLGKILSGSMGHKFLPFQICDDVPGLQC